MSDYVHKPYPSWRYHASQTARIVNDEAEDKALGAGWVESPALAKAEPPKASEPLNAALAAVDAAAVAAPAAAVKTHKPKVK